MTTEIDNDIFAQKNERKHLKFVVAFVIIFDFFYG